MYGLNISDMPFQGSIHSLGFGIHFVPIWIIFHSVDYKMTVAMDIIRLMAQMAFTKLGKKVCNNFVWGETFRSCTEQWGLASHSCFRSDTDSFN